MRPDQRRELAYAVAQAAFNESGLDIGEFHGGNPIDWAEVTNLDVELVRSQQEALDLLQWQILKRLPHDCSLQHEYELAFARARAAHALLFALEDERETAAMEATYEALAAIQAARHEESHEEALAVLLALFQDAETGEAE